MPRSPFASESWEPRFVVEHYETDAILTAVHLWLMCAEDQVTHTNSLVRCVSRRPDAFLAALPGFHDPPGDAWEKLAAPLSPSRLSEAIDAWLLQQADPGQRPDFDGSERKGFAIFWAHHAFESDVKYQRGALVVLPKWFEIHK